MRRTRGGYTIIEVLVVLTVGVIIFFAAITLFAGKQGKTEFSQSMRDVEAQMQSVVNDVSVSLFPNEDKYDCTVTGGGRPTLAPSSEGTGTSQDCIFLGKAVYIDNSSDPNRLLVYTVIGSRLDNSGNLISQINDPASFLNARPEAFTPDTGSGSAPDITEKYQIPFSATVVSARTEKNLGNSQTYLVGFYNGQQSSTDQGSLSLMTLGYTNLTNASQVAASIRNNAPRSGEITKSWNICFQSGTSNEMATLKVLSSSAGISTSVNYGTCS
ncbi:MAG TPA: prepilin-type N-terminal cleavage/methylation domain-containing protein [Candidatus Saccharimonadales bacterium]|nr:prepilin-type N-terminal cleavage/methylation domain-containing protein [Candidatus Saccharimonadales bacterium]